MTAPIFVERVTDDPSRVEYQVVVAAVTENGTATEFTGRVVCTCGSVLDDCPLEIDADSLDALRDRAIVEFTARVPRIVCSGCGERWVWTVA